MISRISLWLCAFLLAFSSLVYYPKWKMNHTEATLSWDVSGYYLYLPAALIYKDIRQLSWWETVEKQYHPGPGMGQAFRHPSGNYVMKYPMGQALQFLPWFTAAHVLAEPLGYPADGFSRPYQAAVSWGSLLIAFLGLWMLRRILLLYFTDRVTALVLFSIVFGSNYLEYAGVTGAMTHNWLFTLICILIYASIRFYRRPSYGWAALIGLCVGWATITRPTEIITALIPLFWGVGNRTALRQRWAFLRAHAAQAGVAVLAAGLMISLQLFYWHYATGEWVVYSYEDQGFNWLKAQVARVLYSGRAGWLTYSPMMIFAIAGMFFLRRRVPDVFPLALGYGLLAIYITAAWKIWWYGGSLGQRALVQSYPLWAFALGAFWHWAIRGRWRKWIFYGLGLFFVYINLWWSHQAHRGGKFIPEQMTWAYILKVLGRADTPRDYLKLLDTPESWFGPEPASVRQVFSENFEKDTTVSTATPTPLEGVRSLVLDGKNQYSPELNIAVAPGAGKWLRVSTRFRCAPKEWEWWQMTQFIVRFRQGDKIVKERMVRLQRHVDGEEAQSIHFETRLPNTPFDRVSLLFWNAGGNKTVWIDEVRADVF